MNNGQSMTREDRSSNVLCLTYSGCFQIGCAKSALIRKIPITRYIEITIRKYVTLSHSSFAIYFLAAIAGVVITKVGFFKIKLTFPLSIYRLKRMGNKKDFWYGV
jgi:hypothetical protein